MFRDEPGNPWVTLRAAIVEFALLVICAGLFIAMCAVSR